MVAFFIFAFIEVPKFEKIFTFLPMIYDTIKINSCQVFIIYKFHYIFHIYIQNHLYAHFPL